MTTTHAPENTALAAVQELEAALDHRGDTRQLTEQRITEAHAEADRILAEARTAAADDARRHHRALLDQAHAEAAAVRAAAQRAASELTSQVEARRGELVAQLTRLVLDPSEDNRCSSR
jgi:vacuolar-type H+-ATPase subunit H